MVTIRAIELRFTEGTSNKFYRVYKGGSYPYNWTQWGRIGTSGQWKENDKYIDDIVYDKQSKGYEDVSGWVTFDVASFSPDDLERGFRLAVNYSDVNVREVEDAKVEEQVEKAKSSLLLMLERAKENT